MLWQNGRRWLTVGLAVLILGELLPAPARLTVVPPLLDGQNLTPPLVFLPFPESKSVRAYANTATWMAITGSNPAPMVNGYSGYFPQMNGQLRDLLADFPTFDGLETLRSLGVRTILITKESLSLEQEARLAAEVADGRLIPTAPLDNFLVYKLPDAQFNPATQYTGEWALDAAVDGDELALRAYAAVPDIQVYVADPVLSPLNWQVRVMGEDGRRLEYPVSPPGTVLLYHDSNRRLLLTIPLPEVAGTYTLTLQNAETGQILGETTVLVPSN